jgi:hypothetical protein
VLNAIEGHLVFGYADGGDAPDKQLQLVPGALNDAISFLKDKAKTQAHFDMVSDLVEGFESPVGLELLSTVHWIIRNEQVKALDNLVPQVYAWSVRKKQFSRRQIELAVDVLSRKGWIENLSVSDKV